MNITIPEITRREIFRVALMRGLTMRKISEMTGINYKTVWAFFRHGVGQRKTVEKIIEATGGRLRIKPPAVEWPENIRTALASVPEVEK